MNRFLLTFNSSEACVAVEKSLENRGYLGYMNFIRSCHYKIYEVNNFQIILMCRSNTACFTSLIVQEMARIVHPHLVIDFGPAMDVKEEHIGELIVSENVVSADMIVGPQGAGSCSFVFGVKQRIQSNSCGWSAIFDKFPYMSKDCSLFKRSQIISSDGVLGADFIDILDKRILGGECIVDSGAFGVASACDFLLIPFIFFKYLQSMEDYKNLLSFEVDAVEFSLLKSHADMLLDSLLEVKK